MINQVDYTSTDRFIPLRRSASECFQVSNSYRNPINISCEDYSRNYRANDSGMNYMRQLYKMSQYNNLLISNMFTSPRRVLYFSPKQKANRNVLSDSIEYGDSWPVKARRTPLITTPELILDMPDIGVNIDMGSSQKVDWGATGYIAAILGNSVHIHNPDTNKRTVIKSDEALGQCIKFNKDGTRMAVALWNRTIGVWDMISEKMIKNSAWQTYSKTITAIEYSSRLLITGLDSGLILLWTHNLELTKISCRGHVGSIVIMKVSCNESFLATSGLDMFVRIWSLPNLKAFFQIYCRLNIVLSLDWHPWKEPILVIGKANSDSFCTMWNVNKPGDIVQNDHPNDPKVDCLTFNPLSGELVVSFWLCCPEETQKSQNIVVQRSSTQVVDDINFHTSRTPYLLWDKTGNRLASVGTDENLALWEFFGEKRKKGVKMNLFPKIKSQLDVTIR